MSFRKEQRKRKYASGCDAERIRHLIQADVGAFRRVHAAQIDGESVVDEYPQIVIAAERQRFTTHVSKWDFDVECKMVIMYIAFITKELIIDRKKVWRVERKPGRIVWRRRERHREIGRQVDARRIVIPRVEIGFAGRCGGRRFSRVDRFAVGAELRGDNPRIGAAEFFKIGM